VIQHFTWVMGAVVVFYFGSKGVLQFMEVKAKNEREARRSANQPKPKPKPADKPT